MAIRRFFALLTVTALPLALACSDKSPTQPVVMQADPAASSEAISPIGRATRSLPTRNIPQNGMIGTWGGPNVTITVGAGSAIISYPCADGTIDQPFLADSTGIFNLIGTHTPESPGPVHPGGPVSHPARYTGTVQGKLMTFTVTQTDSGQTFGPFVLKFGVADRIVKCL